jgi:type IV pilus assembly protein PilM
MIGFPGIQRHGPIGIDLGRRAIKMVQFDADRSRVLDAAAWELPLDQKSDAPEHAQQVIAAISQLRQSHQFRGRDVVVSIDAPDLIVQNIRIPKASAVEQERLIHQEAARRVPFSVADAEIRCVDVADVRQGDTTMHEVILLACHRPVLDKKLELIEGAGLRPIAVDVEPASVLRCYGQQFRRDDDQKRRAMFINLGATNTVVLIAQGMDVLFIKYLEIGGKHLDEAVAKQLNMDPVDAAAVRRHNGDRRADQQDPVVARSVAEAIRPVTERLAHELSLCVRYHSVTFRGQPLVKVILSGGEASEELAEMLSVRLDIKCEVGDPLRPYQTAVSGTRRSQWDVATGLALRHVDPIV